MPENNEAKWYIIHTFGGYEKKVKMSIESYAGAGAGYAGHHPGGFPSD